MKKEKIIGLKNLDDSLWFVLAPTNEALKNLNILFDLHDYLSDENHNPIKSYTKLTKYGEFYFMKDYTLYKRYPKFHAYFIFTKKNIHLILRKVKDYAKMKNKILKYFDFKK